MLFEQAVFLVGGKGTRLGALTNDTPKPMLEIAPGVRFLDILLDRTARYGFTDIVLLAGHLGDQFEMAYNGKRIREAFVTVIRESSPQGTGGALAMAAGRLVDWFLLGNGDSYFEINYRRLASRIDPRMDGRIALREVPDPARYGTVSLRGETITCFHEKNETQTGPALINGGLYFLRRDALLGLIDGPSSIERDVFPRLAASGRLRGEAFEGYFLDIGLPETYAEAEREILSRCRHLDVLLDYEWLCGRCVEEAGTDDLSGALEAVLWLNARGHSVSLIADPDRFSAADVEYGLRQLLEQGAYVERTITLLSTCHDESAGGISIVAPENGDAACARVVFDHGLPATAISIVIAAERRAAAMAAQCDLSVALLRPGDMQSMKAVVKEQERRAGLVR